MSIVLVSRMARAYVSVQAPSFADEMGMIGGGGDSSTILVIPSRLQVFLSRELFGWPLYSIILAFGQVRFPRLCVPDAL